MRDVLHFDIEILPNIVAAWGLHNQNLTHEFIIRESSIVCAAWSWNDEGRIYSASILDDRARFKRDVYDDIAVVRSLREAVDKAKCLIYQNGDRFDLPILKWRSKFHKLPPVPPIKTVDTLKQMRKHFRAPSRRLDYIGRRLGFGGKIDTGGMKLWMKIADGFQGSPEKESAVRKMVTYCKRDVKLLRDVWQEIKNQATNTPNFSLMRGYPGEKCPHCSSATFKKNGYQVKQSRVYQQWACLSCGGYFYSAKSEKGQQADFKPA